MPEGNAVRRINGSHAVIAPAAESVDLAPGAAKHCSFALPKVIRRIAGKTSSIPNSREHGCVRYGIADGCVAICIDGYARHEAPKAIVSVAPISLLNWRGRKRAARNIELVPPDYTGSIGKIKDDCAIRP